MHNASLWQVVSYCLGALIVLGIVVVLAVRQYHRNFRRAFRAEFGFLPNDWEAADVQQGRIDARLGEYDANEKEMDRNIQLLERQLQNMREQEHAIQKSHARATKMAAKRGFMVTS